MKQTRSSESLAKKDLNVIPSGRACSRMMFNFQGSCLSKTLSNCESLSCQMRFASSKLKPDSIHDESCARLSSSSSFIRLPPLVVRICCNIHAVKIYRKVSHPKQNTQQGDYLKANLIKAYSRHFLPRPSTSFIICIKNSSSLL